MDIGCGKGRTSIYFYQNGIKNIISIDGLESNLTELKKYNINVICHDYTLGKLCHNYVYDIGWCCEVVEHIEEKYTNNIIHSFLNVKKLFLTHALPGQKGYHHVHCMPEDYWIDILRSYNFQFNKNETEISRKVSHSYFQKTGKVFDNKNII
jgi:cyclopropane fatty-acyl-phospholipid synthase-like methyltransferase